MGCGASATSAKVMDFDPVNSCGPWIDDEGPLLSLALVLAIDSPAMQVQSIGVILTFYGFLLASAWPWKLPLLNLIDLALAFGIVVLVNAAPLDTRNNAAMPVMAICLLSGIIFVVIVTTLISLIRYFCLKTEDRRLWNLGGLKKPSVIAAKLKEVSLALKTQSQREYAQIERAIGNMSVHDVRQMSTCISILAFELIPMKGHKRSAGGSAWSVMTDNEANFGLTQQRMQTTMVMGGAFVGLHAHHGSPIAMKRIYTRMARLVILQCLWNLTKYLQLRQWICQAHQTLKAFRSCNKHPRPKCRRNFHRLQILKVLLNCHAKRCPFCKQAPMLKCWSIVPISFVECASAWLKCRFFWTQRRRI